MSETSCSTDENKRRWVRAAAGRGRHSRGPRTCDDLGVKNRKELGRFIVADPRICHGKPTFKGTRIMVFQVLNDVARGKSWEFISKVRWGGRVPMAAIGEAVRLAQSSFPDVRFWRLGQGEMRKLLWSR